jgi:hypothetical protein
MKVPENYYDEIFEFKGEWDVPSKCGLRIIHQANTVYLIVTELYQENPGTSVTYAGKSLKQQICEKKNLSLSNIIYIECTPNTNSVLSFYDEQYFEVTHNNNNSQTNYRKLSMEEIKQLFNKKY